MIYLDNAATTPVRPEVVEAMMPYFTNKWYNPSSLYSPSVNVKNDIENARKNVGNFINADGSEIYFTSGASESNCWAIQGFVNDCLDKYPVVITSTIEHKSIIECVNNLRYANKHFINVDSDGFINIEELKSILDDYYYLDNFNSYRILASIQLANNEVGTIQKIKEIAELVHKYNAVFHTDSTQVVGHISIDVKELGIDMMSASGHKLNASKGIGFLYKKNGINIQPLIYGSQMGNMRGGTENVPYIMGMSKAIELCDLGKQNKMIDVRDYFIGRLMKEFRCKVNGSLDSRLPNNINVTFPQNITGESLLYMLDMSRISISTGSACNSKEIKPSHVLKAIGLSNEDAMKTIRITIDDKITYQDVDSVIEEIRKAISLINTNN